AKMPSRCKRMSRCEAPCTFPFAALRCSCYATTSRITLHGHLNISHLLALSAVGSMGSMAFVTIQSAKRADLRRLRFALRPARFEAQHVLAEPELGELATNVQQGLT